MVVLASPIPLVRTAVLVVAKVQKPALVVVLAHQAKATTARLKSLHPPRVAVVAVQGLRLLVKTVALVLRRASLDRQSPMVAVAVLAALLAARVVLAVVALVGPEVTALLVRTGSVAVAVEPVMHLALMAATVLSSSVGFRVAAGHHTLRPARSPVPVPRLRAVLSTTPHTQALAH